MSTQLVRRIAGIFAGVLGVGLVVTFGCTHRPGAGSGTPSLAAPDGPRVETVSPTPPRILDMTDADVVTMVTPATVIDTRTFPDQVQHVGPFEATLRNKAFLPPHERPGPVPDGEANSLSAAASRGAPRAIPGESFPGIIQTGWVPPDPTLAVGPSHIVTTVNQSIAFLTRDGSITFQARLNSSGNPGFFEDVGAGGFTFDPKCFYDHEAQRFVVFAPETYGSTEAWITIAVSDDSDPHGVWYKYRTDAVIQAGSTTYWWDYPGFGYDTAGYYVTSNLFGLNQSGFGGVGFRVFDKAPMLVGDPVVHSTLRDPSGGTVQVAQHFGPNQAPFFVSNASSTSIKVQAIVDPLTAPALVTTTVDVPVFASPPAPPVAGGDTIGITGNGVLNACWRDGALYATHHIASAGKSVARWYEFDTGDWPASGGVGLVQAGDVDPGGDVHAWFPAIYANGAGELGIVFGTSSASQRMAVEVAGRLLTDPPGVMSQPTQVAISGRNGGGRKGDYYDIAIDPIDDTTFWYIGETFETFGWSTEIGSFQVSDPTRPVAGADDAGSVLAASVVPVNVLANDYHPGGLGFDLVSADSTSAQGGLVEVVPGEPRTIAYTAPTGYTGPDSFSYTLEDTAGGIATGTVAASVLQASDYRDPDAAGPIRLGLRAHDYVLSNPQSLPDFDALTPVAERVVNQLSYPRASGPAVGSALADNMGSVFEGFVFVPQLDVYTFTLTSDDGSRLYIGDELVVDNDGVHNFVEVSGSIPLKAGGHAFRVEYFERSGGAGLIAEYAPQGGMREIIPYSALTHPTACASDLAPPDGVLDFTDVNFFLLYFGQGLPPADVAAPHGVFDFADVLTFLTGFGAGCQ